MTLLEQVTIENIAQHLARGDLNLADVLNAMLAQPGLDQVALVDCMLDRIAAMDRQQQVRLTQFVMGLKLDMLWLSGHDVKKVGATR